MERVPNGGGVQADAVGNEAGRLKRSGSGEPR